MEKAFIAYFDLLGFKDFILNNETEDMMRGMSNVFRDIEFSLSHEKNIRIDGSTVIADLSKSNLNCINISDTIIFWTKDCTFESFRELVKVAYDFNWKENCFFFPARGVITYGDVHFVKGDNNNPIGSAYRINCLFGKGLVNAHIKADNMNWAGSVIDQSAIDEISLISDPTSLLAEYTKKYSVPYKQNIIIKEYAFNLVKGELNELAFNNKKNNIEAAFKMYNKGFDARVQEIFANTIQFLETFKEN